MSNKINTNFQFRDQKLSNTELNFDQPRHRWYNYKEGFSKELVQKAIEDANLNFGNIIIDPFNGSGTVTLTAAMSGYKAVGLEVNPFTSFLSKTKVKNADLDQFDTVAETVLKASRRGKKSPLMGFSTFSKTSENSKWLFNDSVLHAFEGGWGRTEMNNSDINRIMQLALIGSAMDNCNARKDGKCLRYYPEWKNLGFDNNSFIHILEQRLAEIRSDLSTNPINTSTILRCGDSRKTLQKEFVPKFDLCITSPPYLNTFDYTDIYRPELFLGKFVDNNDELYALRLKTVRSHIQAKWAKPTVENFGVLYNDVIKKIIAEEENLMSKDIPIMVQAYFEDMKNILTLLKAKAQENASLWLVVSTSAYAGIEIPVDLIIAEIGGKAGWYLREVGVLRYLQKRKSKYSDNITQLRESVVIFDAQKR